MKINKLILIPILLLSAIAKLSATSCITYREVLAPPLFTQNFGAYFLCEQSNGVGIAIGRYLITDGSLEDHANDFSIGYCTDESDTSCTSTIRTANASDGEVFYMKNTTATPPDYFKSTFEYGVGFKDTQAYNTPVSNNSDATLTAGTTVNEPVNLPSTADTLGEAVNVFDFTLTDGGGGDALSTDVSQIVLNTSGTADFSKVRWRLSGANVPNITGTYDSGANTLTFPSLFISVADGTNETYTLLGHYDNPNNLTNHQTYIFSLNGDNDLTVSGSGTQMSGGNTAVNNGSGTQVEITATKLIFQREPSN